MSDGRRLKLTIAYDGTDFHGWQAQAHDRTVQVTLEKALVHLANGKYLRLRAAGRTDAGVHAIGQVADVWYAGRYANEELRDRWNRLLPDDVCVRSIETVADSFHARFQVIEKTYIYQLDTGPTCDPLRRRTAWHLRRELDPERVRYALQRLLGTHDFTAFSAPSCTKQDRVRTVTRAALDMEGERWRFTFTADGFLTYMVRNFVGTMVRAGRLSGEHVDIGAIFATQTPGSSGSTAPAHALRLESVVYDPVSSEER